MNKEDYYEELKENVRCKKCGRLPVFCKHKEFEEKSANN